MIWIYLCLGCCVSPDFAEISDGCQRCDLYGTDDRFDVYEQNDKKLDRVVKATGAILNAHGIGSEPLERQGEFVWLPSNGNLKNYLNWKFGGLPLSDNIHFSFQERADVSCTGFLVAPYLFATARHCVVRNKSLLDGCLDDPEHCLEKSESERLEQACRNLNIAFDYAMRLDGKSSRFIPKSSVYGCHEITTPYDGDFALIRLKRRVTDREHAVLNFQGPGSPSATMAMGFPWGLPMKLSPGKVVERLLTPRTVEALGFLSEERKNHHLSWEKKFIGIIPFQSDIFIGNSGGPLVDESGKVVGIVIGTAEKNRGNLVERLKSASSSEFEKIEDYYIDNHNEVAAFDCQKTGLSCLNYPFALSMQELESVIHYALQE